MSDQWNELRRKYGATDDAALPEGGDSWEALAVKHSKPPETPAADSPSFSAVVNQSPGWTGNSLVDGAISAGNATGTGFWRGATRFAGLPVDTVQNVIDLGKAGTGYAYSKATGKGVPPALEVSPDRTGVVGSGDWLLKQARRTAPGRFMVDPADPNMEGSGFQVAGSALAGGVYRPQTWPQAINQAGLSVSGALSGKAVHELTGDPAWAITASMGPAALQLGLVGATKGAIRGGEKGRKVTQDRVSQLQAAGVDQPTVGMATGNRLLNGVENILSATPGAMSIIGRARDQAVGGMERMTMGAADQASTARGPTEAGMAVQGGVRTFRDDFKARQNRLYDQVEQVIGGQYPTKVDRTSATLAKLNADIEGAPELSKQFKNSRIQSIERAVRADLSQPKVYSPSQLRRARDQAPASLDAFNDVLGEGRLPFQAVKQTRTLVGNELADNPLMSGVPRSKWNPLYASLSDDIREAAQANGPVGTRVFNRANTHTRAGMERLERLEPVEASATPESAYSMVTGYAREGGSPTAFQWVKKSIPQEARAKVAATVIERLGRDTPGQQNASGDAWSPDKFLTNWNKMSAKGRAEMFSGFKGADQVRRDVQRVADAAALTRNGAQVFRNPSGTAAAADMRSRLNSVLTLGSVGAGSVPLAFGGGFDPLAATLAAGSGLGGANLMARALTSPASVAALTKSSGYSVPTLAGLLANQGTQATGLLSKPERKQRGLLDPLAVEFGAPQ